MRRTPVPSSASDLPVSVLPDARPRWSYAPFSSTQRAQATEPKFPGRVNVSSLWARSAPAWVRPHAAHPWTTDRLLVPAIWVVLGLGLVTVAVGNTIARDGSPLAEPVFWAGMVMIWVPTAVRLFGQGASRSERVALLVVLGLGLYVVDVLWSPRYFVGFDEFLHWRTASDIVRTGELFNENSLLPVSPLYPGLEVVTSAIVKLTGLSVFVAGTVLLGVARLIQVLVLYLLFEQVGRSSFAMVGGSSWLAGAATLVFFTSPSRAHDSTYHYEALALPLALLVLYLVARGRDEQRRERDGTTALIVVTLVAVAVTHHVTSFFSLACTLGSLALAAHVLRAPSMRAWLWRIALVDAVIIGVWLLFVANPVVDYLRDPLVGGVGQVIELIRTREPSRQLFESQTGETTSPIWERPASVTFALITLLSLLIGWLRSRRELRTDMFLAVFAFASIAYPVSAIFRFTALGTELSGRIFAFVFVPVAFFIAVAIATRGGMRSNRLRAAGLVLGSVILLYGGVVISQPASGASSSSIRCLGGREVD